ncbi:unnamed protein product [Blepharisma stoltei]|uniref:Aconitate hydratase n=1 Tax=Blepharisma stoltei TaxID=1481888 RepID=A0AAU9JC30_9CILI|nr:unnamed protein product [Blepharisma stoltei]
MLRRISSLTKNPFKHVVQDLNLPTSLQYFSLTALQDSRVLELPYCIRVLLESSVRNCDEFSIKGTDVENILDWQNKSKLDVEIPFKPARVVLQDFTGVPAVVDLAAMRDATVKLGKNPGLINPLCPVDLVIDHSVQVDASRTPDALRTNEEMEFRRNRDRFEFLKWGQNAFKNLQIVPPGSGIVHQVNLEYLARGVFNEDGLLYPDSLVGTDSHTTMINGLGIVGWGVGGIEAEAVMLGQPISMVLPQVIGFKLTGKLPEEVTSTDLVLTITQMLRKKGVVGKFVEFFGEGCRKLSLADKATVANMAPEYGATMGFFPADDQTLKYLEQTGRDPEKIQYISAYLKAQGLFRDYSGIDPKYSDIMELDLSEVQPCIAGPKRPQDKISLSLAKQNFKSCLTSPVGFKGFGLKSASNPQTLTYKGQEYAINHGSVVIAAITSCTNTSNPDVMLAAGVLAKNAVEKGLKVKPYIKTSLSPGSGVVSKYLEAAGVLPFLNELGFYHAGYGCMTCIGNSGDLDPEVIDAITKGDLVAAAVLSGNRNFEGRVNPFTRANYLASPPLVVAYALAGRMDIDFEKEPLGNVNGTDVFLRDVWPSRKEMQNLTNSVIKPQMFKEIYGRIAQGTDKWNQLQAPTGEMYNWTENTYIHNPPYFQSLTHDLPSIPDITDAYCLLKLGDSITTDHISPAGNIGKTSPAARFLQEKGVSQSDFNTYGARRGNDEVMKRGTFANIRLINQLVEKPGPTTVHFPTEQEMSVFDASEEYRKNNQNLIVLAGKEYGSGSSRDWAAKGTLLLGIRAVIAESYERIHRSNLIGMGVLPLQFKEGENAESLGLTGKEKFTINLKGGDIKVKEEISVKTDKGTEFQVVARIDTDVEVEYFKNGGILPYVLRKLCA